MYGQFLPEGAKETVFLVLSTIQGAVGVVAHHYNTDGTAQATAFVPPPEPKSF